MCKIRFGKGFLLVINQILIRSASSFGDSIASMIYRFVIVASNDARWHDQETEWCCPETAPVGLHGSGSDSAVEDTFW
jgi:hypothetical protein